MYENDKSVILVVDDDPENIQILNGILGSLYRIKAATKGKKALRICASENKPDLVLLDVVMPEMDGYEVCRRLKADEQTKTIPVIFITAMNEENSESLGLAMGAVDYIAKPINPFIVLQRVKNHLLIKASADFLKDKNAFLHEEVEKRTREITAIQDVTIQALASLAETRDSDTGYHILRTQHYVRVLAEHLKGHPRFHEYLKGDTVNLLYKSAPLHDIGKVGIPDQILLKPGQFVSNEYEVMKKHTTLGYEALLNAEESLGVHMEFLSLAKEITLTHHEKWDGTGYPQGLSGEDIPISARLMALADVYDALRSRRVYKEGMSHDEAVETIKEGSGTHFDPDIVEAFLEIKEKFLKIAEQYSN